MATDAHEGPVYVCDPEALYFTTVPQNVNVPAPGYKTVAISRLIRQRTRPRSPSCASPPTWPTAPWTAKAASSSANRAPSPAPPPSPAWTTTGRHQSLVEQWFHLPFNSPNDIVVKSDGSIWFTDPSYGFLQSFKPEPLVGDYVYRFDPATGSLAVVADNFNKPNGLAFHSDESILYINDSAAIQGPAPTTAPCPTTTSWPSTSKTAPTSPTAASSPSSPPASPTASRSTPPAASTPPPPTASSTTRATSSAPSSSTTWPTSPSAAPTATSSTSQRHHHPSRPHSSPRRHPPHLTPRSNLLRAGRQERSWRSGGTGFCRGWHAAGPERRLS